MCHEVRKNYTLFSMEYKLPTSKVLITPNSNFLCLNYRDEFGNRVNINILNNKFKKPFFCSSTSSILLQENKEKMRKCYC